MRGLAFYAISFLPLLGLTSVWGDLCLDQGVAVPSLLALGVGWLYIRIGYHAGPPKVRRNDAFVAAVAVSSISLAMGLVGLGMLLQDPDPQWLVDPATISGATSLAGLVMNIPQALGMAIAYRSLPRPSPDPSLDPQGTSCPK
jgi:hypothetical protein